MLRWKSWIGPAVELARRLGRVRFEGVLVALTYEDEVLCVQHSYQPQGQLELVGGGTKHHLPAIAAQLEVEQELRITLEIKDLVRLGQFHPGNNPRRTIYAFTYEVPTRELWRRSGEIELLHWLPLDSDDRRLTPGAKYVIGLVREHRQPRKPAPISAR